MPDKKLTDSEIIKALEESISFDEPYESDFTLIRIKYIKNALDLINRYEEKNSNLTSDLTSLQNDLTSAKAEIERLKEENEKLQYYLDSECSRSADVSAMLIGEEKIKAEAYKECIEKVKEYIDTHEHLSCEECECVPISKNGLDNLLNELVGGDNEQSNT